jgi:cytidylate kinase
MIVAIDGPAASGKSTVARALARRLGMGYLDTGAMYRSVAWLALRDGVSVEDEAALVELARAHPVSFVVGPASPWPQVMVDGRDVTGLIRNPEVDTAVSPVSRMPRVRRIMVDGQRAVAGDGTDWVVEGRDIGTVVFPDAAVKVFITATAEERARRRAADERAAGLMPSVDDTQARIEARDHYDSSREASPLVAADDAQLIDTTGMSVEQVVDAIVALVEGARS